MVNRRFGAYAGRQQGEVDFSLWWLISQKAIAMVCRYALVAVLVIALLPSSTLLSQENAAQRRLKALEFSIRSSQSTGLLVPMYIYPANVHTNEQFNRLMDTKRKHPTVPFLVIANPASGPGDQVDANYTKAIDRMLGAGCMVIGYVSTSYSKRSQSDVQAEIVRWKKFYPRVQGIFFDEMVYEDNDTAQNYQTQLNQFAKAEGLWPTVANPGTATPERYFSKDAADIIVVHESDQWPEKKAIHGDYFGGYADYPTFGRGILIYGQKTLDLKAIDTMQQHARWIYVTHDPYKIGSTTMPNPWDELSVHLEELCRIIEGKSSK